VDENEPARLFLAVALKTSAPGATLSEAASRKDAAKAYRDARPDIVFVETQVGSDSGVAVMNDIYKENPRACVIVCSGKSVDQPEVQEAITRGAFAYLPKPIRIDTVRRTLREVEQEIAGLGRIL
jgi:DNA-binding NtrC family response regulator